MMILSVAPASDCVMHELVSAGAFTYLATMDHTDWSHEGYLLPPEMRCSAWSVAGADRCPKQGVASLAAKESVGWRWLALCGGHFNRHRSGKPVRIA